MRRPWREYTASGLIGFTYNKIKMSNEEIAHFLIEAENEKQALNRIQEAYEWFNSCVKWADLSINHPQLIL